MRTKIQVAIYLSSDKVTVVDIQLHFVLQATFKSKAGVKVQAGFPPLFVCFVALVGMYLGFLLSS